MSKLILHPVTEQAMAHTLARPAHALLLSAPSGAGKSAVALWLAGQLLQLPDTADLGNAAGLHIVRATDGKPLSIDDIRGVQHFLSLRPASAATISRVVLIEDAHELGHEAQNALLKTLEEPPAAAVIILTTRNEQLLLPTIRSRVEHLPLRLPDNAALADYFTKQGHDADTVKQALLMGGGLPGLVQALLESDEQHPLREAARLARDILQKTTFERLALVDGLSKQRPLAADTLFILEQMADVALHQAGKGTAHVRRWQHVLATCYDAARQLQSNAQPKLILTNFMLAL